MKRDRLRTNTMTCFFFKVKVICPFHPSESVFTHRITGHPLVASPPLGEANRLSCVKKYNIFGLLRDVPCFIYAVEQDTQSFPLIEPTHHIRNRAQKFPAWHTKAAPNGKCCEGYIVPSVVRLMYQLKSVLKQRETMMKNSKVVLFLSP